MPFYQLHVDCELNNVQSLGFAPSHDPTIQFSIRCTGCSETTEKAVVSLSDAHEDPSGDNSNCILHWVSKCKHCKSEMKVWISELKKCEKEGVIKVKYTLPTLSSHYCRIGTISDEGEDDKSHAKVKNTLFAVLEARRGEITAWEAINTEWKGNAGNEFFDVGDLSEDGFYDVNNDNEEVSVTLQQYRVQ